MGYRSLGKEKAKYIRDFGDFSRGDVFRWQSKVQNVEPVPVNITSTRTLQNPPRPPSTPVNTSYVPPFSGNE